MDSIARSIEVAVPVRTAYNQWTQFESFPQFMEGVTRIRQLDERRLQWAARIAGQRVEWTAEIQQQIPDQRVSWRSTSGTENSGTVTFQPVGEHRTLITLRLFYDPEAFGQALGPASEAVEARVDSDLERFKDFIESRGTETGAWRSEIPSRALEEPSR